MAKSSITKKLQGIPLDKIEAYLERQKKYAKQQSQKLLKQRERLLASLESVDAQLAILGIKSGAKAKRTVGRPKKAAIKGRRRKRAEAGKLDKAILTVLQSEKKPLRLKDIVDQILSRDLYKKSKYIGNQVYLKIKNMAQVKKVGRGTYALKKSSPKPARKRKTSK